MARVGASKVRHGVTLESLSQKCFILSDAKRITKKQTTQRGKRTILHSYLSRQFKTNDQLLRYNRLQHNFFTNTIQAGTISRRGNLYAQVYSNGFGSSSVHSMKKKGGAHETLSLFFKRDGVPPKMVMDG